MALNRPDWQLSQAAFDRLLAALGPDSLSAAERYERIRDRLLKLFEWRGCSDPAALVDTTFDRVARRLEEGAELTVREPYAYVHGVALHVLQEHWRGAGRTRLGLEDADVAAVAAAPEPDADEELGKLDAGRRLRCLQRCLRAMPAESRQLLEAYHADTGDRIARRQELAHELGITLNALRIQAFRLRGRLQQCIATCVERSGEAKRIVPLRTLGWEESRR